MCLSGSGSATTLFANVSNLSGRKWTFSHISSYLVTSAANTKALGAAACPCPQETVALPRGIPTWHSPSLHVQGENTESWHSVLPNFNQIFIKSHYDSLLIHIQCTQSTDISKTAFKVWPWSHSHFRNYLFPLQLQNVFGGQERRCFSLL